jgi:two-component system response regulator AtoC
MKRVVLVVDDDRRGRRLLQIMVEGLGLESAAAENGDEALRVIDAQKIDVVVTDLRMPGMSGIDLLKRIRELDSEVPVVVLTAYATVETAVQAMKQGAFDYVLRPFDVETMESTIRRALEMRQVRVENRFLREQVRETLESEDFIGASGDLQEIYDLIGKVAPAKSSVLITGETGTGKELVARTIHRMSPRRDQLFVAVNCAAIPADLLESELFGHARGAFTGAERDRAGKFEVASEGTLFLDEIGEMPPALQAKLLRVLQEEVLEPIGSNKRIPIDVRVLASTNRDLPAAMAEGRFRPDLYYRLNVIHMQLPPLRQRPGDIDPLLRFFLDRFSRELGKQPPELTDAAIQLFRQHAWPGNVRELRNVMERTAVLCRGREIDAEFVRSLIPELAERELVHEPETLQLEPAVERLERKLILRALGATGDNKVQAARLLGISERTLWYKLKRYDL